MAIRSAFLVCVVLVASAGCTRFDALNATVPGWGYRATTGIAYADDPRQRLDVYRPGRAKPGAPVVVFFYGGGWREGDRADYRFVAEAFTSRGYVTVIPDYRLYPNVTFPAFVEDAAKAVRWTRDNVGRYGGDADRLFLVGHSAGAHTVMLLTVDERYLDAAGVGRNAVRAAAGLSGPYDFRATGEYRPVFQTPDGDLPVEAFNPIYYAEGDEPPLLLIQGTNDTTVDPANALRLARRVRERGGAVRHLSYRGSGHADTVLSLAWSFRWMASTLDDVVGFFEAQ